MDAELKAGRDAQLAGDPATAAGVFEALTVRQPSDPEARYWLASALMLLGEPDRAQQTLNDARTLHTVAVAASRGADLARLRAEPAYAAAVAARLYEQDCVAMSSVIWGMVIAADHIDAQILANYALTLQHQGRVEEASDIYRAGVDHFSNAQLHQFLVYAQLFCEDGERRHAVEARTWASRWIQAPPPVALANARRAGRRLRIGYVAPSFAGSQLRQFITPILQSHDPKAVEVFLYVTDAATETGWPAWIQVRSIGRLNDPEAAELIRKDRIDVLNDCWGHTAGSRLAVFAHRPAPVQAAWINFFQTTGLPQMDYVLHAASADAPDFAELFNETIWPVGPVFTPFRPAAARLAPAPTPARTVGRVTFGSFNHPAKLSPNAIAAWAAVLRCKPDSQLLLKYRYFTDPVLQRSTQTHFAAHGVAPERLTFAGHSGGEDYFKAFQSVDLMLDSWPAPGSTTTLEALSNGVPVLAMVGPEPNVGGFYARTILQAVGLADLVATSPEDFVQRALALTEDLEALDRLRGQVRPGFEASPICDEGGFTRGLEAAYGQMFERWEACAYPSFDAAAGGRAS